MSCGKQQAWLDESPCTWADFVRVVLTLVAFSVLTDATWAQDATLPTPPPTKQQVQIGPEAAQAAFIPGEHSLENGSFLYRKLPPEAEQRELQINDIITVLVDYKTSTLSSGDAQNRRTIGLNAVLADWIKFDGKNIIPSAQSHGSPAVNGQLNSQYRTTSEMELNDALAFRIAAAVVDIRPNGNLVIEARREISINEEMWTQSLTGVVRRQSIGPDRTVRSDEVAELRIQKKERGFINDSYSRGWFAKWYDKWKPF